MKPQLTAKPYYRIGEVSELLGVEPHVLRYWESEFPTIRPQKSKKGQRVYSQKDVDKLVRVKELLRNQGFTIAGARKQLRAPPSPEEQSALLQAAAPPEPPVPTTDNRALRRELVALRREIVRMLDDLSMPANRG